ncbi:hypothetical protein BFJ70_g17354 [Fusarium oxysporum]|nr:hypothetical protein NW769_015224 [Fusarium oxysporum]KAJ4212684.1 hypothetical protein NW760_015280 [Fusarium oxysporum]RKL02453.1 hypothetical protein BFJ70_g17354 [Fusarium oxysporum]
MLSTVSQCLAALPLVNVGVAHTIPDGFLITHRSELKRESKVPVVFNQTDLVLMCESTFGDSAEHNADLWYGTAADYELDYFIS